MNCKLDYIDKDNVSVTITVPWEIVQDDYDKLLKRYAKMPIKGFRQAPLKVVETTFRKQLDNDLANSCVGRLCRQALQKEQIMVASPIAVTEIKVDAGNIFGFVAQFLKMPEFDLPDYLNLQLTPGTYEEKCTEVSEKLLSRTKIDLPVAFIDNELQYGDTAITEATDKDRAMAAERASLFLILKKIAEQDVIEVSPQVLEQQLTDIAQENGMTLQETRDYFMQNGGLDRLKDYVLAEQVLNYIIENQQ